MKIIRKLKVASVLINLGLGVITKTYIDKLNNRFIILKDTINENMIYSVDNEPIRIIKLFYDTTV